MECAGTGSRTPCCDPPTRRCHRCRAVSYCSIAHQGLHWSAHKGECAKLEEQMKCADVLNDFPSTFVQVAALFQWGCGRVNVVVVDGELVMITQGCSMVGIFQVSYLPVKPLTVYWPVQLTLLESLLPQVGSKLRIHSLGPEKELLQLAIFGELRALLPGVELHIDLIGPAIPNHRGRMMLSKSCNVTLRLHSGCYHDSYRELVKGSFPDLVIVPNAGIAAYLSWLPTLKLIKEMKVHAVFSGYCEKASHLAVSCISSVAGAAPRVQIQLNPLR